MGKLDFLKNWKILIWIVLVLASIAAIAPALDSQGLVVVAKDANSTAPVETGEIIYFINGQAVTPEVIDREYEGIVRKELK